MVDEYRVLGGDEFVDRHEHDGNGFPVGQGHGLESAQAVEPVWGVWVQAASLVRPVTVVVRLAMFRSRVQRTEEFGMASVQHMQTIDRRLAELGQLDPGLAGAWQDMIAQLAYDDILTDHRAGIVIAALTAAIDTAVGAAH